MRILHLMRGSEQIYGAERVLLAELTALAQRGIDVVLLMLEETRLGTCRDRMGQAVEALDVPVIRVAVDRPFSIEMVADVRGAIARAAPDLVHAHGYKGDVIGLMAAFAAGVPIVGEVSGWLFPRHDWQIRCYEWLDVQALKRMNRVIVLCGFYRRMMLRMGFRSQKLRVIPSGVDVRTLRGRAGRVDIRQAVGLPTGRPVVGMLTRLSPEKGVDLFLRALALVVRRHPEVLGIVFGEGPQGPALQTLADRLGLDSCLRWTGYVHEAVDALLALDVVVQSSRIEALPQTVMEAMAMGRPVVVTAVGGCPELVLHGETGFVAPADDHEKLAAYISYLLDHLEHAREMGRRGAARIDAYFTIDHWTNAACRLYHEVCEAQRGRCLRGRCFSFLR